MRKELITKWPKELYSELLDYTTDPQWGYEASKAVAQAAWDLWAEGDTTTEDLSIYTHIDLQIHRVKGCPGTVPAVAAALASLQRVP